jgi:putative restriction endonuclease
MTICVLLAGLRVRLGDGFSLVDAAHLIPFNVSGDDKPNNGLALCPNHHRAMDRFLIAPCPDPKLKAGVWRVSSTLDERKDSRRDLVGLAGRPVLEPSESKFLPAPESLRWREEKLPK